ncbi:MAG: PmbA/TldA family metallopeptidase [Solirubrobacterales bacterium]
MSAPLLEPDLAGRVIERALARGGDFAELFCEESRTFGVSIDESRVERPQSGAERGAGVRVLDGETAYFAHVDGLGEDDLLRAADAAAAALHGERTQPQPLAALAESAPQEIEHAPGEVAAERKAELLRAADELAREQGEAIDQVSASYAEGRRRVAIFNSDGTSAADERTRVRFGAQVVAKRNATV